MNLNLTFTRNSPLRTILVNADTHQPLYKIETPRKIIRKTTRLRKIAPGTHIDLEDDADNDSHDHSNSDPTSNSNDGDGHSDEHHEETNVTTEDDEIARIHWHFFSSDRVVYKGKIMKRSQLFPKFKRGYTFSVNGVDYKWKLGFSGISAPVLVLNDGSKTVIAQFHTQNNFINRRKPYLEITPSGMEILDDIILSFIFVETKRRTRERRMRTSAMSGSGAV